MSHTSEIVRIDGLVPGEPMITRQKYEKRLRCHQFVFEIRLLVPTEESDIKLATLEVVGQLCRVVARNPDFDILSRNSSSLSSACATCAQTECHGVRERR
jgi:hypothetical protein